VHIAVTQGHYPFSLFGAFEFYNTWGLSTLYNVAQKVIEGVPELKTLSRKELEDLVVGATILGSGGGGSPEAGLKSIFEQVDAGNSVRIAQIEDYGSQDLLASPYFVGSVAPSKEHVEPRIRNPVGKAIELVESRLGRRLAGTVASEIGGGNTAASLAIAAQLGITALDGDLMGRAGPELHQSTVHICGRPMTPAAIVSESGNQLLVEGCCSIDDYEAIARYVSVVSGGHAAVVDTPLTKEDAEQCVLLGTLSKCIEIGSTIRKANEAGDEPVKAAASVLPNGKVIFEGVVSKYSWRDERGFLFGDAYVQGTGRWGGHVFKSWIQNEHIMGWLDNQPLVMPPDPYVFLNSSTGRGITNDKLREGMEVVVVASSIAEIWRSPKGIELFGPRHFGFDFDYVPFERLAKDV
jgi:DUF917 family protein